LAPTSLLFVFCSLALIISINCPTRPVGSGLPLFINASSFATQACASANSCGVSARSRSDGVDLDQVDASFKKGVLTVNTAEDCGGSKGGKENYSQGRMIFCH
jgi:hypothetical protein